ncbi:diphosphate--fructose-6-phosphate 1-phosphotransferase [Salimicrobium sp. PL1-032A]|uniref:diphosphate--fructose-6-phosphate 1-phosphotransferase n=1 Tax=Salimicrobium sp. PL1-032A TaxID=3095364 RepID=UPI003260D1A7
MKKIAVGQAGGPTAVINATLAGVVEQLQDRECEIYFVEDGYEGLVNKRFFKGDDVLTNWILNNRHTPGACLTSGRYHLQDEGIQKAVTNLQQQGIQTLLFIGGNGTMEALHKIKKEALRRDIDLQVIGLPKTVDNDLGGTDHAPGFASAANYIAQTIKDMSRDLHSMKNFEQVRVLETMGRNSGWLAAASGAFKEYSEEGPHFIAIPERPLDENLLLSSVEQAIEEYGYAVVVVSEGVTFKESSQSLVNKVDGRIMLGGISKTISEFLSSTLNLTTRAELLGMNQRASSGYVSKTDAKEAYEIGKKGADFVHEGYDNVMVSIRRDPTRYYTIEMSEVSLQTVIADGERLMPPHFINDLEAYNKWLIPLLGGEFPSYPPVLKGELKTSEYKSQYQ